MAILRKRDRWEVRIYEDGCARSVGTFPTWDEAKAFEQQYRTKHERRPMRARGFNYSPEERLAIVKESWKPDVDKRVLLKQYGISDRALVRWRTEYRTGLLEIKVAEHDKVARHYRRFKKECGEDACWIRPRTRAAELRRELWERYVGEIDSDEFIMNRCGNKKCVNPNHATVEWREEPPRGYVKCLEKKTVNF